jgi:hypothetical protein
MHVVDGLACVFALGFVIFSADRPTLHEDYLNRSNRKLTAMTLGRLTCKNTDEPTNAHAPVKLVA